MRTIIHEVVADIDDDAAEIVLAIHWAGGVHTGLRLPRPRRGQRNCTSADIIDAVRQLVLFVDDDLIAGVLNRNGFVTGNGNRWTRERVTSFRSYHRIPPFRPTPEETEPWLNLGDAARLLGVASKTLRANPTQSKLAILRSREVQMQYLYPTCSAAIAAEVTQ